MSFIRHICLMLALSCLCMGSATEARAATPNETAQIEALLKKHPELVLNVLREHGGELLEIVQQAADERRSSTLQKQWEDDMRKPKKVNLSGRPEGGASDAPVTIVAYSDLL